MRNSKGFSIVEGLLLLVLIGGLGFIGWYVVSAQHKTNSIYDTTAKTASVSPVKSKQDKTATWKTYSSATAEFSLKYPANWSLGKNQENCPDLLMLSSEANFAGACQSDATPEIAVTSQSGDKSVDLALAKSYYPDLKKEPVTLNGVSGYKYSGTLKTDQEIFVGPGNGTKSIAFIFYTNSRTYAATYNQVPTAPDIATDFNTIVTQTLQFHK